MSRWAVAGHTVPVRAARGRPLLDGEVQAVRWLHVRHGKHLAARIIGCTDATFSKIVRGLRVSAKTRAKVQRATGGRVVHVCETVQ
jgi:hypothetical protein